MKIAILGAPGSGKSKLAKGLARRLNNQVETKMWTVVDGYVQRLQGHSDHPYGFLVDYREHFMAVAARWIAEDEAQYDGYSTITCGSIYESMIYASGPSLAIRHLGDEQMMLQETQVAMIMMQALGICEERFFDYDILFYLPLKGVDEPVKWEHVVDAKLSEILDSVGKYALNLDGKYRQQVDTATNVVNDIYAAAGNNQVPSANADEGE